VLIDSVSTQNLTFISLLKIGGRARIPIVQDARYNLMQARLSPDERSIVFVERVDAGHSRIYAAPYQDAGKSPESSWVALTNGESWDTAPAWSADGRTVYYTSSRDGFRCVWGQRIDGSRRPVGEPAGVHHFHIAKLSPGLAPFNGMDMCVGGGQIFLSLGEMTGDIWMAKAPE